MDFKEILIKLRKVIAVLFSIGFDKHLDYDQEEITEEESHTDNEI
jgi:hypothetical protein